MSAKAQSTLAQSTLAQSNSAESAAPLVRVEDVHTYYGKSHILHGVSLNVGPGEVVGLLGRNGVALIEMPSNRTVPRLGRTSPMMVLSVVLLPTPLRPRSPTTSPGATLSDTP